MRNERELATIDACIAIVHKYYTDFIAKNPDVDADMLEKYVFEPNKKICQAMERLKEA